MLINENEKPRIARDWSPQVMGMDGPLHRESLQVVAEVANQPFTHF